MQHLGYKATFPLLLNIASQPTYFMSLKDSAGLVKMYAMVNVQQYQIVATGKTVEECEKNYITLLSQNGIETHEPVVDTKKTVSGVIGEILSAVVDGNTHYYIKLRGEDCYYVVSVNNSALAPVLTPGDSVEITVSDDTGEIREAYGVTRK